MKQHPFYRFPSVVRALELEKRKQAREAKKIQVEKILQKPRRK